MLKAAVQTPKQQDVFRSFNSHFDFISHRKRELQWKDASFVIDFMHTVSLLVC